MPGTLSADQGQLTDTVQVGGLTTQAQQFRTMELRG
jgi:hypothetical protein